MVQRVTSSRDCVLIHVPEHIPFCSERLNRTTKICGNVLFSSDGICLVANIQSSHYNGAAPDEQPVAFVGKGITFDSGGISIKPSAVSDHFTGGQALFGADR